MAGSWDHITDRHGRFAGLGTVENLGDAEEALTQCYGMIMYLAEIVAAGTGEDRLAVVTEAQSFYKAGLEFGGRNTDGPPVHH